MATPKQNTIYLTKEEDARIRTRIKQRVAQSTEKKGEKREPRDAKAAHQAATGAALMADMGGAPDPDSASQGDTIPAIAVGIPYEPCTKSLDELEAMIMSDLTMETHHRGKKLIVHRDSPVVTLAARSWTMVQNESGKDAERLEMCLHKKQHGEDILESSKRFIIKEPYFTLTEDLEPTLRVDHPSDLVILTEKYNPKDAASAEKSATILKNNGNTALKKQDLPLAYEKYTEGLKIAQLDLVKEANPDLARDIHRNRAYINLLLGRLDEAISDAHVSLLRRDDDRSKDLDSKAHYRAGCAAYNLGWYNQAKFFFDGQLKLAPEDKDAKTYLKRIAARNKEIETGEYDLLRLRTGLSRARPRVDAATFLSNTVVKSSPGKGRGLFATRDIPAGSLIMAEKAYCIVYGHEPAALTAMTYDVRDERIRVAPVGLTRAVVEKMINNPSTIGDVYELYSDWNGSSTTEDSNDEGIVDTFRIHDAISRNAFGCGSQFGEKGARDASTGIWLNAAATNHSCVPNTSKEFIGDLLLLRALTPIKKDEEIVHAYDENLDYDARQAALMTTWGFTCSCALCKAEEADGKEVRDKRMEAIGEADAFIDKTPWAGAKRVALRKAQRLREGIEGSYDGERYNGLPRPGVKSIDEWLRRAAPQK